MEIQKTPVIIPGLDSIVRLAAGAQHVLALDNKGNLFTWGCGEHGQLGRWVSTRSKDVKGWLRPTIVSKLPVRNARPSTIACGARHNFVIDTQGRVYAWGDNRLAQLGVGDDPDLDEPFISQPQQVTALAKYKVSDIAGGQFHSLACTEKGLLFSWGRYIYHATGLRSRSLSEDNAIFDDDGEPHVVTLPTRVKGKSISLTHQPACILIVN